MYVLFWECDTKCMHDKQTVLQLYEKENILRRSWMKKKSLETSGSSGWKSGDTCLYIQELMSTLRNLMHKQLNKSNFYCKVSRTLWHTFHVLLFLIFLLYVVSFFVVFTIHQTWPLYGDNYLACNCGWHHWWILPTTSCRCNHPSTRLNDWTRRVQSTLTCLACWPRGTFKIQKIKSQNASLRRDAPRGHLLILQD